MKKTLLSCFLLILFTACSGQSIDDFSFADLFTDQTASHIKIKNAAGTQLVLFKDSLIEANKLGGVPTTSSFPFGITQLNGLQVLRAIDIEDYKKFYGGDLTQSRILDSVLAYVSDYYTTNIIVDRTGGSKTTGITIENTTSHFIEVYSGYWGQNFIAALKGGETVRQYLPAQNLDLYACQVTPVYKDGTITYLKRENLVKNIGALYANESFPKFRVQQSIDATAKKFAYIHVKNLYNNGLRFGNTGEVYLSTLNHYIINPDGAVEVYQFSPITGTSGISLAGLRLYGAVQTPIGNITLANGEHRYFIIKADGTVDTNASESEF